jgi:hypothetical protein
MIHTRPASSRQISTKWFPPPSDPSWLALLPLARCGCRAAILLNPASRSACQRRVTASGITSQPPFACRLWRLEKPWGTASSMAARKVARLSGRSPALRLVCTAIMPHPISTPTAAGMMAPLVGITLPTVAPMPACTSGITATCLWMKGMRAAFRTCLRAISSKATPLVQDFTGTAPGSDITS